MYINFGQNLYLILENVWKKENLQNLPVCYPASAGPADHEAGNKETLSARARGCVTYQR